jgi:hypothetical protein
VGNVVEDEPGKLIATRDKTGGKLDRLGISQKLHDEKADLEEPPGLNRLRDLPYA